MWGVLRANKGGFCITFEKIGFKHAVYAFVYSKSSLLPAKGFSYIESTKKILLQTETLTLYFIIKWMFA